MKKVTIYILFIFLFSCSKEEGVATKKKKVAPHSFLANANDLIVLNSLTDTIVILDHNGEFKKVLYRLEQPNAVTLVGLAWLPGSSEILTISNHTTDADDKILAISIQDGTVRTFAQNADLANLNFSDITVLNDGDIILTEANLIERFTVHGSRVSSAIFPTTNLHTTPSQLSALSNGGFILCSIGSDRVQLFDDAATPGIFAISTIAVPALPLSTDVTGCLELNNGEIAITLSGTNDALLILNPGLTAEVARFRNSLVLSTPRAITQGYNDKIYVLDSALNSLTILDNDANYIKTVTDFLATPTHIISIPD